MPFSSLKRVLGACLLALALAHPASALSSALVRTSDDFSSVAEKVSRWVVNISSSHLARPVFNDPFLSQFFNMPTEERARHSLGSGIIFSADGQILTNWHVVENADEVTVRLLSGDEYKATVVGGDENVDLAVLKIHARQPLPTAVLGNSDQVRVGQWAIAIGNPLGFSHSVTVGVISAKGRENVLGEEGAGRYQNFLQTDASINPGNSGGPLCNIRGEVIGINAAIVTTNQNASGMGGSIGIGFAIPINMAKRAIPDLVKRGKVVLPELGFYPQDVTPELARTMRLGSNRGVLITDVAAGGPAAKAGLTRGDVIVAVGGKSVADGTELRNVLYEYKPGETIQLEVLRKGGSMTVTLVGADPRAATNGFWHGLQVVGNSQARASQMGLATPLGVVVSRVAKRSQASEILQSGDVILQVNDEPIRTLGDWNKVVDGLPDSRDAYLLVLRDRAQAYVELRGE
jgi:serine protease Do